MFPLEVSELFLAPYCSRSCNFPSVTLAAKQFNYNPNTGNLLTGRMGALGSYLRGLKHQMESSLVPIWSSCSFSSNLWGLGECSVVL